MTGEVATEVAVRFKGIMAGDLGLFRVGMAEVAGQFVTVDPDVMLSGQRLKLGKGWGPFQLLGYAEGHVTGPEAKG